MAASEEPLAAYLRSRKSKTWGLEDARIKGDHTATKTLEDQERTQTLCLRCYALASDKLFGAGDDAGYLNKEKHAEFARKSLTTTLPYYFNSLDASRTWICYWNVHTLRALREKVPEPDTIFQFLKRCYNFDSGGFAGGPGQLSHLAPTYSAINALVELDLPEAYAFIGKIRASLAGFIMSLKNIDGSFVMHKNGEYDTRSAYCAISVATLCKIEDLVDFSGTFEWLLRCQTYEGGFAGIPGAEAHGGYTFCGLAGLVLLDSKRYSHRHRPSLLKLTHWLAHRQMTVEGGFNGRTNKLVDACYSFWQGACPRIIQKYLLNTTQKLYNDTALAGYVLACCQAKSGGIIDKPGKGPDYYHTCYGLSGYSLTDAAKKDKMMDLNALHNVHQEYVDRVEQFIRSESETGLTLDDCNDEL